MALQRVRIRNKNKNKPGQIEQTWPICSIPSILQPVCYKLPVLTLPGNLYNKAKQQYIQFTCCCILREDRRQHRGQVFHSIISCSGLEYEGSSEAKSSLTLKSYITPKIPTLNPARKLTQGTHTIP